MSFYVKKWKIYEQNTYIFYTSHSKPRRIEKIKKFELCVLSINLVIFDKETQNRNDRSTTKPVLEKNYLEPDAFSDK